ncbi:MAG TPA: alpha/beta hydrolase, partial [Chlamydiales bacterium]|nr:alpha/beta hydrolase [Chlamydiales bacterium]
HKMKKPTMILQARADNNTSYAEAQRISKEIPHAQFVRIDGSGHLIWLGKNTNKWEHKLVHFLKEHHH